MAFLVDPSSEYGYWEECVDEDVVHMPSIEMATVTSQHRLAGFHEILGQESMVGEEICGLDVLGAPGELKTKKMPGTTLVNQGVNLVKKNLKKITFKKTAAISKDKAAKLHPVHAAPAAFSSAARAQAAGTRALKAASKKPLQTVIHGDRGNVSVLIGAAPKPVVVKKMTLKQKQAVDRFNKAVERSKKAGEVAAKSGTAALVQAKKTQDLIKSSSAAVKSMMSKRTAMHGEGDDAPRDVPVAVPPSIDKAVPSLPPDGVPYNGEKGWPKNQFGSLYYFYADEKGVWGYVWGWDRFPHGVFIDTDTPRWVCVYGRNSGSANGLNWDDYKLGDPKAAGDPNVVSMISDYSLQGVSFGGKTTGVADGTFGPLIGNPDSDFKNLRWFTVSKQWGWFLEEAPSWATADLRYAAAKILQEKEAADKAAADADAAAKAKEQADAEAEKARQDAANALAEQQATSEAKVEETKRQSQQAQMDLDAQKQAQELAAQQAQFDLEMQRQQAQLDLQYQQMQLEQAQQGGYGGDAGGGDQFALPGEGGFQAQPGMPDMTSPMDIDSAYAQGQAQDEGNPFSDLPPNAGEVPDWGGDEGEPVATDPRQEMLGMTPRGEWR